jgi:hypothetical protein
MKEKSYIFLWCFLHGIFYGCNGPGKIQNDNPIPLETAIKKLERNPAAPQ